MNQAEAFIEEITDRGVGATKRLAVEGESFRLPAGPESIYTTSDPKDVYAVLEAARRYASSDTCGPHIGILNLVARRGDIKRGRTRAWPDVSWYTAQPIGEPADSLVSMRSWLEEHGLDVELIMRGESSTEG